MAITKEIVVKGVTASYWKINSQACDYMNNSTRVELGIYASKAVRDANLTDYLAMRTFTFESSDLTRKEMYATIKALEEMVGCIDS